MRSRGRSFAGLALSLLVFASCSDDESPSSGTGARGSGATGGVAAAGGAGGAGGTLGTGDSSASGGSSAAGGSSGNAGSGANGGGSATGGSGGSVTGGTAGSGATGGASATGGTAGSAGSSGSGATSGASGRGGTSGNDGGPTMQPYKGVANSPCAARTALNVSWYYNWTQRETEPCSNGSGGEFVPMLWGHTGAEQSASGISSAIATMVSRGYKTVLGFNEPDNPSQSNIPVATAISLWPSFDNAAIRVGSPGTAANASPGQAWFTNFMNQLNANQSLRADFLAIHWYGWNAGSCDANASQLENYIRWAERFAGNRPIWITEWGCLNQSAPDATTVINFFKGAVAMFARHPRIERYAWYPWATNCGLNDASGNLTALGREYAAAPAYK
jgi:hypothetical protein